MGEKGFSVVDGELGKIYTREFVFVSEFPLSEGHISTEMLMRLFSDLWDL